MAPFHSQINWRPHILGTLNAMVIHVSLCPSVKIALAKHTQSGDCRPIVGVTCADVKSIPNVDGGSGGIDKAERNAQHS